jgi:hypothetical protein
MGAKADTTRGQVPRATITAEPSVSTTTRPGAVSTGRLDRRRSVGDRDGAVRPAEAVKMFPEGS